MDIKFITNQPLLEQFVDSIQEQPWIGIDTEFVREKTYYPQPGLIQIATDSRIVCVDPVAISNLSSFFAVLNNPAVVKIFHAAGQDLELLACMYSSGLQNLFDTQIAADLLGEGNQIGYAGLVKKKTGITLPKSHTRTNWLKRPLSNEQITYAADDVRYLGEIYASQREKLKECGRLTWLEEDCQSLLNKLQQEQSPDQLLVRIKGHQELSGVQRSIARELAVWREQAAKKRDLPRRWILADNIMIQIAQSKIDSLSGLEQNGGLSDAQFRNNSAVLLEAILRGASVDQANWPAAPNHTRSSAEFTDRLNQLRKMVRQIAEKENLNPPILANRKDLERLVEGKTDIPLMQGWRYEIAGREVQDFLT